MFDSSKPNLGKLHYTPFPKKLHLNKIGNSWNKNPSYLKSKKSLQSADLRFYDIWGPQLLQSTLPCPNSTSRYCQEQICSCWGILKSVAKIAGKFIREINTPKQTGFFSSKNVVQNPIKPPGKTWSQKHLKSPPAITQTHWLRQTDSCLGGSWLNQSPVENQLWGSNGQFQGGLGTKQKDLTIGAWVSMLVLVVFWLI